MSRYLDSRGGHQSGVPESTPTGFCVFLSEKESKLCEKLDPEPHFIFGSSRNLRGLSTRHIFGKTILILGCIDGERQSEQESDSQI